MDSNSPRPLRESLQEIMISAERASELTHQLVAYAGDASLEVDAVDLSSVLREMARLLRAGVPKSARLSIEAESGIWVRGDSTQLQQVMMNLITNASESIGDGSGTIRLRTGSMHAGADFLAECQLAEGLEAGEYAYFEVADDGVGIDPDVLPRIFDPFFTTELRGRGLGLAATLGVVRSHAGALFIRSEPNHGTRVRVLLPRARARTESVGGSASRSVPGLAGTILAVDDQARALRITERMLGRLGLVAITAEGGREALRVFRERCAEIDPVLLDLTMPEMNGEQVFRELRAIRADLPVVLMSGHSEQRVAERLAGEGRVSRLQKPFQLAALAARLEEALQPAPARGVSSARPDPSG